MSRLLFVLPLCLPALASGQDLSVERARSLWDPQALMKDACEGISRHYQLNADQKDYTCKLLTERVTQFLEKHDKEFWPLLTELTRLQLMGDEPDQETARQISQRGYHIFLDAKREIMRGQDDFRKILNDEQKKIHDRDLKGLNLQFNVIDRRLQRWQQGQIQGQAPLQGVRLHSGRPIIPESAMAVGSVKSLRDESKWEQYVREFIENYRLDESQKASALAILKDLKDQARAYRRKHSESLLTAAQYVREARLAKPFDDQARKELQKAERIDLLLNKPFDDWFEELRGRLEQIPTEKQKADFYQRFPHLRPATVARQTVEKPEPTTRPASTQPATPAPAVAAPPKPAAVTAPDNAQAPATTKSDKK